ncbi:MAG: hypothetical protein ACOCRU_02505, partial [bacterium]
YNFINNYYKPGPNSNQSGYLFFDEKSSVAQAYFAGNYMEGQEFENQWDLVRLRFSNYFGRTPEQTIEEYKQDKPLNTAYIYTEKADKAYETVLSFAGAFPRDSVDTRVIETVRNGTGRIIDSQEDVGGWPEMKSLPAPDDSDKDGMPDYWEIDMGLDPEDPSDAADINGDGYTNIEIYINQLAEDLLNN